MGKFLRMLANGANSTCNALNRDNQDWDIKPPQVAKARRERLVLITLCVPAASCGG